MFRIELSFLAGRQLDWGSLRNAKRRSYPMIPECSLREHDNDEEPINRKIALLRKAGNRIQKRDQNLRRAVSGT
jgi:hypothetical protein